MINSYIAASAGTVAILGGIATTSLWVDNRYAHTLQVAGQFEQIERSRALRDINQELQHIETSIEFLEYKRSTAPTASKYKIDKRIKYLEERRHYYENKKDNIQ